MVRYNIAQLIEATNIDNLNSANGVRKVKIQSDAECAAPKVGYFKPISNTYPEVLAINELLMLADYALVLPPEKVTLKYPVYEDEVNLVGVCSEEIPEFEDMRNANLTAEQLKERGFIETLFACYFRMENDLHCGNITSNARVFDADKSNYPYIASIIGRRCIETVSEVTRAVSSLSFTIEPSNNFLMDVNLIMDFPIPNSGPFFWPTHTYAASGVKTAYPNSAVFNQLSQEIETQQRTFLAVLKELMVTREERFQAYKQFTDDQTIINTYLDIMDNRKKQLQLLLVQHYAKFNENLIENKNSLLVQLVNHFDNVFIPIAENDINQRFQKILFEISSAKISAIIKELIQAQHTYREPNGFNLLGRSFDDALSLQEKLINQTYYKIINLFSKALKDNQNILPYDLLNTSKQILAKTKEILSSKAYAHTQNDDVIESLNEIEKKLISAVNDINLNDKAYYHDHHNLQLSIFSNDNQTKDHIAFVIVEPESVLPDKTPLISSIAQAIIFYLDRTPIDNINSTIMKGYQAYKARGATMINSAFSFASFGFFDGTSIVQTKTEHFSQPNNIRFNINTFIDTANNNAFETTSQNSYILNAIFEAIKAKLIDMCAIEIAAHYPEISFYTQQDIESFDLFSNSSAIFQEMKIHYNALIANSDNIANVNNNNFINLPANTNQLGMH